MGRRSLFYCNSRGQGLVNDEIVDGLSSDFDVIGGSPLYDCLVEDIVGSVQASGLVTHFPMGARMLNPHWNGPNFDAYSGAVDMLETIRRNRPHLPILVYTGAGVGYGNGEEGMRKIIIDAGANDVVFKNDPRGDVVEIRDKMVELVGLE